MLCKPLARTDALVVQNLDSELLIYDREKNKAFSLNETSAKVWRLCDGTRSVAEISDEISEQLKELVGEDLVWIALDQFSKDGLLVDDEMVVNHFAGISRRSVIRKVGFASVVALPVISSIVAPTSAQAQSNNCFAPGTSAISGGPGPGSTCTDPILCGAFAANCCSSTATFTPDPLCMGGLATCVCD